MLLIGDPGSAKTRLLQAVTSLVPKGIYVSGKSTTSAGLTAAAEKDEFAEGGWVLKAGALVLGSGGEVSIDEFDKVSDEDKSSLLEAMESQTISVAKAGIVARFNTKTSILAAANPKYGRFDPNSYPAEQFDILPSSPVNCKCVKHVLKQGYSKLGVPLFYGFRKMGFRACFG